MSLLALSVFLVILTGLILLTYMVSSVCRCITPRHRLPSVQLSNFREEGTHLVSKYMHIQSQERTPLAHFGSSEQFLANHFDQTDGLLFLEIRYSFLWPCRWDMVMNSSLNGGWAYSPNWEVVSLEREGMVGRPKKQRPLLYRWSICRMQGGQ